MFLMAWNLLRGATGRAITAIRDHPIAGVEHGDQYSRSTSLLTFGVSAMYTGIAGALGALVAQFVSPDSFSIFLSLSLLVGAVIGGVTSLSGAIFGAIFIELVPDLADQISKAVTWAVYGSFIIGFAALAPTGIAGFLTTIVRRLGLYSKAHQGPVPPLPRLGSGFELRKRSK